MGNDPCSPSDGPLQPHPWRLGEPPPPLPQAAVPPLLLLVHCGDPLPATEREALLASLSPEERQRVGAYRQPDDRQRSLVARASLRQLLGQWLALPPAAIPITTSLRGKPHCPSPGAPEFNLSHSGELILLGFHSCCAVGVDVERLRQDWDWGPIARRILPAADVDALQALPSAERASAFLAAWCAMEALLKARGEGLAGLERLRARDCSGAIPPPERLWTVAVPGGYAAAAALHTP
ncbi:MAG: 4'-phosphopantetheinyl transferase superfamily protein [Cyanobacteriota bacterium]|nr:4'-phosphopantetheinyl transferase superfamily protein [Cyanobacteriota bacterium]